MAVLFRYSEVSRNARFVQTIGRFVLIDEQMRDHARRAQRDCSLVWSTDEGILYRYVGQPGEKLAVYLPVGFRLDRFRSPHLHVSRGEARIHFSAGGTSPTYAVRFVGPGRRRQWLLVVGLTGQKIQDATEDEVDAAFQVVSDKLRASEDA